MTWEGWLTTGVVLTVVTLLATTSIQADVLLWAGLALLFFAGVVDAPTTLGGFSNEGMVTVALLYVVVAGLRETGGIGWMVAHVLGRPKTNTGAQIRLMAPVVVISAFLNNTPVVAMFIPAIVDWAKRFRLSVSKLLLPLSYAAILGGTCTLIGTSTNIVVHGMMVQQKLPLLSLFEIARVGIPVAVIGVLYILIASRWLLPDRVPAMRFLSDPREYTTEMIVKEGGPLIGRSIEQAGLRHLPGVYLIEIDRMGVVLPAVGPQEVLQANDRLVFAGIVDSVVELHKIRGLEPATDQVFKLNAPRSTRCLVEAVVSASCPIVGRSIREGRFRGLYNAVVIAVARGGERINRKIGDIVLRAGDTLLLEAHPSFADSQRNSRDFFLVSRLENSNPPRHERILVSIGILVAMIIAASTGWLTMFQAALAATGLMIATRCCSAEAGIRNIEIRVLLAIAASFGIGAALQSSGVAQSMSEWITALAPSQPVVALALVYAVTLLLTELITNNAAAVLMFPIALATSHRLGVDFKPFAVVLMMAASHGYATPLGYQTHLMVYGPGGYRFSDFMRIGVPLDILIAILTIAIVPFAWPFQTAG